MNSRLLSTLALTGALSSVHADPAVYEAGRVSFAAKCALCHSIDPAGGHLAGPNLNGVLGRPVAGAAGFVYSESLKAAGGQWDSTRLSAFLKDPKSTAPGTVMPFAGMKSDKERRALVCYMSGSAASLDCK